MEKSKKIKKKKKSHRSSGSVDKKKKKSSKKKSGKRKKSKKESPEKEVINQTQDPEQSNKARSPSIKKSESKELKEVNKNLKVEDPIKIKVNINKPKKEIQLPNKKELERLRSPSSSNNKHQIKSNYKTPVNIKSSVTYLNSHYKRDCTKNIGFFDSREEQMKVKFRQVIPEYISPHLQREEGFISELESDHKCKIAFITDSETKVSTCEGVKGQLIQFSGSLDGVASAMKNLTKKIMKIEQRLNGKRKS